MSVPYVPRGDVSVFERMRKSGHQNDFYMFEQMKPEADQIWADAAVTIPGVLYWASGSAPADKQWSPFGSYAKPSSSSSGAVAVMGRTRLRRS